MKDDPASVFLPDPEPLETDRPEGGRWRPLRSGILNLFKYDNEVFPFVKGRLLLRGNNGTGKSRVLALQLPFLLEGDIHSSRVEPDADSAKRFEWHLLMGRDSLSSRTGYTWMEFGRRDAEGRPHFLTLGCGLKISYGGKLDRWHFITDQRIGLDLLLVREDRTPLPKDLLKAELGERGLVYPTNREYARAVDERLFRVGERGGVREERYKALLDLLVELRRPQLSRELDEKKINRILASALPAPDMAMLTDVADGFESLEHDRQELKAHEASEKALTAFSQVHNDYLKCAISRRALELTSAHNRFERDRRQWIVDREQSAQAEADLKTSTQAEADARGAKEKAEAEKIALENSPGMDVVRELALLDEDARKKEEDSKRREEEATGNETRLAQARLASEASDRQVGETRGAAERQCRQFGDYARQLGLPCPTPETGKDQALAARERSAVEASLTTLKRYSDNLRQEWKKANLADKEAEAAKSDRLKQETRHADALIRLGQARDQQAHEIAELTAAAARWSSRAKQLVLPSPDTALELLDAWAQAVEGDNPFRAAVEGARLRLNGDLVRLRTESKTRLGEWNNERDALETEKLELEKGVTPEPESPYWRSASIRRQPGRPGAPLWKLCDFRDDITETDRAGYEAALEASGLLDSWLTPDGEWIGRDGDVYLDTRGLVSAADGGLNRVLRYAPDPDDASACALAAHVVEKALSAVGRSAGDSTRITFADAGGHWRNGTLAGRHQKPAAEFFGAGARAERRRRRLAEIAELQTQLDRQIAREKAALSTLDRRQEEADEEYRTLPSDDLLRQAGATRLATEAETRREKSALDEQIRREEQARNKAQEARTAYVARAAELGLQEWKDDLDAFEGAIRDVRAQQGELDRAWMAWRNALQHQATVDQHREDAQILYDDCFRRQQLVRQQADQARRKYEALKTVSGHKAEEAREQLRILVEMVKTQTIAWEQADTAKGNAKEKMGAKRQKVEDQERICTQSEVGRTEAVERFRRFLQTGVLRELRIPGSGLPPDAAMTALIDLARVCDDLVPEDDRTEQAWTRSKNRLTESFETLKASLSAQDLPIGMELREDIQIIEVKYNGAIHRIDQVREMLAAEVADRRRILTERERELLENHLVGEVADHLHRRIHEAHALVNDMNAELEHRRTSTGMQLKFEWGVPERRDDDPDGHVRAACGILARQSATWSDEDRRYIAQFLQERIQLARAEDEASEWRESVARAVDYRPWRLFRVWRCQDKIWKPLTRKTHGTGSGGEKAVALTIPLFAAAAAHYHHAPFAPRLIMLDEAFAGIDREMVNECMGLLAKFDLDFVMTSEREWGTYPSIDGLSICWLSVHPDFDAVDVSRWRWDGRQRTRMDAAPGLFGRPASTETSP